MVRELDELEAVMTRIEALPVMSLAGLNPGRMVRLRARAELGSRTLLAIIPSKITTHSVVSRGFLPPEQM